MYLNQDAITSKNIVGGGQLRSTSNGCELASRPKVNASSRSIKGGEGNYASLMSSNFADTWTMLTNSDFSVGGGEKQYSHLSKGGKPLFRLAPTTRNDLQNGGGRYLVSAPIGGAIYGN